MGEACRRAAEVVLQRWMRWEEWWAGARNGLGVAELPGLTDRLVARQDRVVDFVAARVPRRGRLSRPGLTWVCQGASLVLLLAIGTVVESTVVWALVSIPMAVIMFLVLVSFEERRAANPPKLRIPGDEDHAIVWAASRAAADAPTVLLTPIFRHPPFDADLDRSNPG